MDNVKETLAYVMSLMKLELQDKLEKQGHGRKGSSKLIDSMEYQIRGAALLYIADLLVEDYGIFVDKGVTSERIPYQEGSGKKTSKYIQGLIKFWLRKGLSAKNAKSAAFALAKKHKKEGMPTRSSFRFSKDGTRLGFLKTTVDGIEARLFEVLESNMAESFEGRVAELLKRFETTL